MKKTKIKKTLCDLDKNEIEEHIEEIASIVSEPQYLCRKCARVAINKKYLCKPIKIKSSEKNNDEQNAKA